MGVSEGASYQPEPYRGVRFGVLQRRRNTLFGMDARILALTDDEAVNEANISAEDEELLRRVTHRYSDALRTIKDELEAGSPKKERVVSLAYDALTDLPESEPLEDGEHVSVRMCQWMTRDRFSDLARILDTSEDGDDVLAEARKRVARAFAPMTLR